MRHQTRSWGVRALPVFLLLASVLPLSSQILVVEPGCAKAGDTVLVTGTGWAEPNPVCEYLFYFNGAEFIARQPDGLYGPPNRTGTIPAGTAPGKHTIKVELRLTGDGSLLQCRQTKIDVVANIKDPWDGGITTPDMIGLKAKFNPADVCYVTPCGRIIFIQIKQPLGEKKDGTTRPLTHTEQGFANATALDADLTSAGYSVDYVGTPANPYYPFSTHGEQGAKPRTAEMEDFPRRVDSSYPADITKIILNFETLVYCVEGTNKGEYLGKLLWKWERSLKGHPKATFDEVNRDPPTQNALDSIEHWSTNPNHKFEMPKKMPPTSGGEPCN